MKLAMACDHAGFVLKQQLLHSLRTQNYLVHDLGTFSPKPVDYPDIAEKIARMIQTRQVDRGILICGSGVGAAIAANKFEGVRAGLCHDAYSAHQGVEHDNMNVLCLGERVIKFDLAKKLVGLFLKARFSAATRHRRRVKKIEAIEKAGGLARRQRIDE